MLAKLIDSTVKYSAWPRIGLGVLFLFFFLNQIVYLDRGPTKIVTYGLTHPRGGPGEGSSQDL